MIVRQIEVDIDVFAAIWAQRLPGEASENDILKRLFAPELPASTKPLFERKRKNLEGKSSKMSKFPSTGMRNEVGKVRWVDDVGIALVELGGEASLKDIYAAVEVRRRDAGRSVPRRLDATIRRTLEDHSEDSANFKGTNLFALRSRGVWALR